ncbi:alanine racemase [Catenovulum maritimum]|uniref:Alanine racemase n=1 Tax=Catenovulum maritimum TaxID=1513271 RepID=A0A0J8GW49_9ALTE|nr:alanine racemase [Catenovulum maritimum]KMT65499.1 alanine racemase [Catenovulum maritimum]
MKTAVAEVSLSALKHNLLQVKKLAKDSKIMAVCKANGYGHGLIKVAEALSDADAYGVARIEEAFKLRASGISKSILLLEGFFSEEDIPVLSVNNFQTVIHTEQQLAQLEQSNLDIPIKVWLKIDTGMSRLGISINQVEEFLARLKACPNVSDDIVAMTHLACADEIDNEFNHTQIARFTRCVKAHNLSKTSVSNSAAVITNLFYNSTWVRPGIMLYGVSPMQNSSGSENNLIPAMTFKTKIISIKSILTGDKVGYSGTWQAKQDTNLAVIAVGYGDGYPRHAKNGTPVWLNGREVPLVGRVSMDMITVDLGPHSQDKIGDEVILWGNELAIERVAAWCDTIAYELLCQLTTRVEWKYINTD